MLDHIFSVGPGSRLRETLSQGFESRKEFLSLDVINPKLAGSEPFF